MAFPLNNVFLASSQLLFHPSEDLKTGYEEVQPDESEGQTSSSSLQVVEGSFYICPICLLVARDPIEVPCCKHWYCCKCLLHFKDLPNPQLLEGDVKCAFCRADFCLLETVTIHLISRRLIYFKLRVKCSFHCGKAGPLQEIAKHEALDCKLRPLICPFPNCGRVLNAEDMPGHLESCLFKAMYCPNCRVEVECSQFEFHSCIESLQFIVVKLTQQLQVQRQKPIPRCKLGPRGHYVIRSSLELLDKTPIEEFCHLYGKPLPIRIFDVSSSEAKKNKSSDDAASSPAKLERQNAVTENETRVIEVHFEEAEAEPQLHLPTLPPLSEIFSHAAAAATLNTPTTSISASSTTDSTLQSNSQQ